MQKMHLLFLFAFLSPLSPLLAGNQIFEIKGMHIIMELTVPGSPEQIYDAITGDISGWWDHSFSEKPLKFFIEAKPGGGFFEIFDQSGDGVQHAIVTCAHRGKLLRFEGPLGLSGRAIHMVHSYEFATQGTDSTRLKLTVNGLGDVNQETADIVERVWHHFLFERFKLYVESGYKRLE